MLILVALASAACPVARTTDELRGALGEVEAGWGRDMEAFASGVEGVRAILPCVSGALDPETAAGVHRAEGLSAFSTRDMEAARRDFAAARGADPNYVLSTTLAPEGNPLRAEWDAVALTAPALPVPKAAGLRSFVDGRSQDVRAGDRPAVVQYVDAAGRARLTALVAGDVAVPSPPATHAAPTATAIARPVPWAWIASSAVTGIASAVFLERAFDADADYRASKSISSANDRREPVNELAGVALGCGVASASFGAIAVVKGVF